MVQHGFCADRLHRMFGLKLTRAHVRLLVSIINQNTEI
jgi:hypothetical protein